MINLNDASYDAKEGTVIFNDGVAGIVENLTAAVTKKTKEDNENSPEYKLTFTDANGGTCSSSFWYVEKATSYSTIDEQITKQGKVLKHIIHAIYGADYQLPTFQDARGMLDGCMKLIREGLASGLKFRIFANYGTKDSRKKYIQPRSWVPFMEPMSVDIASTRLKAGDLDGMTRLTEDSLVDTSGPANADTLVDDEEW